MRHIPDEELHAYLDQALSRSQCVEIERHLARCPQCQEGRDAIAALRDRTTELLSRLGPPPIIPPAFEVLRLRRAQRIRRRWHWAQRGVWAASLVAAVALGWQVDGHLRRAAVQAGMSEPPRPAQLAAAPAQTPPPKIGHVAVEPPRSQPIGTTRSPTEHRVRAGRPAPVAQATAAAVQFARVSPSDPDTDDPNRSAAAPVARLASADIPDLQAQPVGGDPALQGLWRTILPDSTGPSPANDVPLVPGLPVVQLRVQPGNGSSEVTAVDQLLESGETIRTIAGPAARVYSLVDGEVATARGHADTDAGGRMTVTIRQGDRMVAVTGPSQALGSLLSRVNVKRRY
ncbi:MAG TPA: zf-HC2 domain-containing protein [Gemmatimonadales bacterium]|nr:zf-HC2 domain-containing protein [Gemmatimonadales bacterium]